MRAAVYGRESRGKKKSIDDQIAAGHELVKAEGWALAGTYSDKVSASRFGTKVRGGWAEVRAAINGDDRPDVLILWESSRGDRTPGTWIEFLNDCRAAGVRIHLLSEDETYDPRKPRQWKTLANAGVDSAYETDVMSERLRRGVAQAARAGRPPAGRCPFGYMRRYDQATGALVAQEPDPVTAPLVAEIVDRVSRSETLGKIAKDFNARGIPAPEGGPWYVGRLRRIAQNRVYLGERRHKNEWHEAAWPAIVDPVAFATAGRILSAPGRNMHGPNTRPGKQTHLLTVYALCGKEGCGQQAIGRNKNGGLYACRRGHFAVNRAAVDELVRDLAVARLSDPELYAALEQAADAADASLKAARAEVAELTRDLEEYRAAARARKISPASFIELEAGLLADIEAAQKRIDATTVPTDLEGWVGPEADVRARWDAANVGARRRVLKALRLKVTLLGSRRSKHMSVADRVQFDWI